MFIAKKVLFGLGMISLATYVVAGVLLVTDKSFRAQSKRYWKEVLG